MAMTINTNAPKPYTVLTTVKSESGSWAYEIRTSHKTGITYCTCKGYQFHKKCKHMDAHRANPTIAVPHPSSFPQKPKKLTPGQMLQSELSALGLNIAQPSANAIAARILSAAGKVAAGAEPDPVCETGRVIILPD